MSLIPYALSRSVLFRLDPEAAHDLTIDMLARTQNTPLACAYSTTRVEDPVTLAGLTFTVPSAKEVGFGAISAGLPEPIVVGVGSDILSGLVLSVDYRTRELYLRRAG